MTDKEKKVIIRYNQELLDLCLKRDGASINKEQNKLKRESIISFVCNCGKEKNKSLLFSVQNIYNHLTFGEEIISNIDEAISVMRISESIINEIKK